MSEELQSLAPLLHPIPVVTEILGLGRTTVFELLASGELESVTVGRRRLVPQQALESFVARLLSEQRGLGA
jgi:excisionase family DNA binding protein